MHGTGPSGRFRGTHDASRGVRLRVRHAGRGYRAAGLIGFGTPGGTGWRPVASGGVLAATIIFYDFYHKQNPLSPVVMGLCRMLVYVTAAYAVVATPPREVFVMALLLLSYLVGLTYVAKQNTWAGSAISGRSRSWRCR